MRSRITGTGQQGLSLLEVVVTLAILAMSLGVILQSFSASMRASQTNGHLFQAVTLAENNLQRVGVDLPLQPGVFSGRYESPSRLDWTLSISRYDPGLEGLASTIPITPLLIRSEVRWPGPRGNGQARHVQLESIRLGWGSD